MSATDRYVPAAGRAWLTGLYDPVMALTMRERAFHVELLAAVLSDPRPRVVLDMGCGTGTLIAELTQMDPSLQIVGIDGDEDVLARARKKTASVSERVRLSRGSADALPLDDSSVDAVIASLLLHHLPAKSKLGALEEAHRVLRPHGRLLVADWGRPRDPIMRAAFFTLQLLDGFENTRDHAAGRLPSLIAQAGFSAVSVQQHWRTAWGRLELIAAEA